MSLEMLEDSEKMPDMHRLLEISSAYDHGGCIQHLTLMRDKLYMV